MGNLLQLPNEVIEKILIKLPIDSLVCAIRTCHKFSDAAAGSRELLIWHITYLPGTKQFIFKFTTKELFRMFFRRATQHLYGMQLAADRAEYVLENDKLDTNLSSFAEHKEIEGSVRAFLIPTGSSKVHVVGPDGSQKARVGDESFFSGDLDSVKIIAVSYSRGIAAILYQKEAHQRITRSNDSSLQENPISQYDNESTSFVLAQYAYETGSLLSELHISKGSERHEAFWPVNIAVYSQDRFAVQWQRMLDRQRILDQKPALAISEVTLHERNATSNGDMTSKVIEERMGPYLQNPYVAKNLFEIRFAEDGDLLKLYLQQSVVPVGALNVRDGGYYCRNHLIVPDIGPCYCEVPFYQKAEAYRASSLKNDGESSVLPHDGLHYQVFHLLLAQPALPHNTPLEDHSLLFVVKHSLHLDSYRYENRLFPKDFPSKEGGDCQIVATLDSWGTVEPMKMRADAIAVNRAGSRIACIRSSRDILVWGFDPAELCRVDKYPVIEQIDRDFDTRLRHTRLYRNAPNLRPITLDCNGAEPVKLKWSADSSDELVVITDRGIQSWNLGLRASGMKQCQNMSLS